jgi:hypothetical protein
LSTFWVHNIKKNNYHYESVAKTKKENSDWYILRYCLRIHLERLWKNYNNSAGITAISSKDILNQLIDLGVNLKFLLAPGECLPSNHFHHHNTDIFAQLSPRSYPAHTRDFSGQTKAQFCSQAATFAVTQGHCSHYSD